uniref:Neuregulin 2b n=1 Tax=Cyclopterus lumpus TaxID=8103 RepID=A0A8C3AC68_CYCLU
GVNGRAVSTSAPKLRLMRGQSLVEGDKLNLKCEASGNPSPSFRWYKDGHELQKGRDLKIKTNKKNSKVQISRVRAEDSGNYTCVLSLHVSFCAIVLLAVTTTTPSPGVSHARRCNDSEKAHCVNGGDCYFIHGINQLSCKGRGALSEAGADDHRHLRGAAGGWHRVCGGLLQNQVSQTAEIQLAS